jgi:MFS family permease
MIGAISGGAFVKYGKWNMIMACNISSLVGYGFCVYAELYSVMIGRFFLGLAIGGYCVFCPKFVNEITPVEYRGPVGAMSVVATATGIVIVSIYGFYAPEDGASNSERWFFARLVWGTPIVFVVL